MKYIKSINEDFGGESGAFGDTYGYGGANGILKINYKPFDENMNNSMDWYMYKNCINNYISNIAYLFK